MDKFKLAHTAKPPKIAKPIQKPKPKYFQKKIKELLAEVPVSITDKRKDKVREEAAKCLTNVVGNEVKDRSNILHLLNKKKSKASRKKAKDLKSDTHHSEEINSKDKNSRTTQEHTDTLRKENVVSPPESHFPPLEATISEEATLDSLSRTNENKRVKKHKKIHGDNALNQPESPKTDFQPQSSIATDISNKSSSETSTSKTKENILYVRKEKRITDAIHHLRAKTLKKTKSHKHKKQENLSSTSPETKDSQNDNPLEPNKHTGNKDTTSEHKVHKIGALPKKNVPKLICKKPLISKSENTKPNILLKRKKKAKKDKAPFKETNQHINSKEENVSSNRSLQEKERIPETLSSVPSSTAGKMISSNKSKKNPKKKKKKIQSGLSSEIGSLATNSEHPSELNNNITSREVDTVHSPVIENKEIAQKKISKKKREVLLSINTTTENLGSIKSNKESSTLEILEDSTSQSVHSHNQEAVTSSGFNVEVIEAEDIKCCTSESANLNLHKESKQIEIERSKVVSSPKPADEQDLCKKLEGKKTKNLKQKLDSWEECLETYGDFIVDIEEPRQQPHSSSGEQQLDSTPLVVTVINTAEPPSVPEIFYSTENISSPEKRTEIHSVIQEFIPDASEAQSILSKAASKKNGKSQKQTVTHDTSADVLWSTEHKGKPRKRKFTEEYKYPESINTQQEGTKHKILTEPLIISANTNIESFPIPSPLAVGTDEPQAPSKNIADMHSIIQFLLGSQEKDSFFETPVSINSELKDNNEIFESAQEPASPEKNTDNSSVELENPINTNGESLVRTSKPNENVDKKMDSTVEEEYTEILQDLENDKNSITKQNACEPLLVEMKDAALSVIPPVFDRISSESVSATPEVHSNSLIEHFIPDLCKDEHLEESRPAAVVSTIGDDVLTNQKKKNESNKKQQKQLDEELDDAETEDDSIKFYSIPRCSRFLLLMKYPSSLFFKGKLTISVLSGLVEVLGYVIKSKENSKHVIYSPKGSSLMSLQTCESDENEVVNYMSLMETLVKIGMDTSVTKDILSNLGQRDCLIIIEEAPANNLEEFVKKLPSDMHFFDVSNEKRSKRNLMSCLHQAQKKLGCIFELPSSNKSFRRYTKNPQWDALVQDIISCNMENVHNGPVSTMVCGGKGVGKSTFLRYFVNKCITEFEKILWLDFDPGQAEFVLPGCVAAVVVEEPLLGPNFTHLKKAERMVFVGDVNISQCPIQYLESVSHVINYCQSQSELRRIPWLVNTMGFCKGLGVDLTTSIIRLLNPHKVVQIQSESFKRNFPQILSPEYAASYPSIWRTGPAPGSVTLNYDIHVIYTMTDSRVAENTGQWGMEPRRLREAMILSYLSQMVKPPGYSIFDIVPYVTPFHKLTLCICHRQVPYAHMLNAMNGNLVALCYYDGNEALVPNDPQLPKVMSHQPVCPCLGFGIVRGIDTQEKNLFLITPVPLQDLQQVNCLMMGAIMLPAYLYTTAENGMGHVPYVSTGPGQPTSKVIRRFFRPLEERTRDCQSV